MIAIGCTGGRHRSVAIAEHLAERYRDDDDLDVAVAHRDIEQPAARRLSRATPTPLRDAPDSDGSTGRRCARGR